MTYANHDLDETPYDLFGHLDDLLNDVDINDNAVIVWRAIALQAFLVSLYYPNLSQFEDSSERQPRVDMNALAARHAAVKLYEHTAALRSHNRSIRIKLPSAIAVKKGLSSKLKRDQLLKDCLGLEREGLSALQDDLSQREYTSRLSRQFVKSRAVAAWINAYLTNGDDLPNTGRRPPGQGIMRGALCDSEIFEQSEKTLSNYLSELRPASVFHYLIWFQGCRQVLRPTNPSSPKFAQIILRRARAVDELAGVCQMYNTVALELNERHGFSFELVANVPQVESAYNSPPFRHPYNPGLARHIAAVAGRTG